MKFINHISYIEFLKKDKNFEKNYYKHFLEKEKFFYIKAHKNNMKVLYIHDKNIFRKISFNKDGLDKIYSDYRGTCWYLKKTNRNKKKFIKKFYNKKKFKAIDLYEINGVKLKSWENLSKNFEHLIIIFNQYVKTFTKKKYHNIHGDLTLDNIIFEKKKVNIIDWEFYNAAPKLWGYDIAYLFLSAISLPFIANNECSDKDIRLFKLLWKKLSDINVSISIIKNPYVFFERSINKDKILVASKKISKKKFFPFITPSHFKKKIVDIINE